MGLFTSKKKRLEMEEQKRQEEAAKKEAQKKAKEAAKKEAEELCAKEGHLWKEVPYKNNRFTYKEELFTCLPIDFCMNEKCTRCGAKRKQRMEGTPEFSVPDVLKCPIAYKNKAVGEYHLRIDSSSSYCMQAKKDIPSERIDKGDYFFVVVPISRYVDIGNYQQNNKHSLQSEEIIDYGDMPGLVTFRKELCFVDDNDQVISKANITVEPYSDTSGLFKIGLLPVPKNGKLQVVCEIEE